MGREGSRSPERDVDNERARSVARELSLFARFSTEGASSVRRVGIRCEESVCVDWRWEMLLGTIYAG